MCLINFFFEFRHLLLMRGRPDSIYEEKLKIGWKIEEDLQARLFWALEEPVPERSIIQWIFYFSSEMDFH